VRTVLHKAIRLLFKGDLDSETDTTSPDNDNGSRISIKWVRGGGLRGGKNAGKGMISMSLLPVEVIEIYPQVAVTIGRRGGTSPHTFISRYKKLIAIRMMPSRTSPDFFTQT